MTVLASQHLETIVQTNVMQIFAHSKCFFVYFLQLGRHDELPQITFIETAGTDILELAVILECHVP